MTLISESSFSTSLIKTLKDIHFEIKRANKLKETELQLIRESNKQYESFHKEHELLDKDIDDAIDHAKNINLNLGQTTRSLDRVERELQKSDTEADSWF